MVPKCPLYRGSTTIMNNSSSSWRTALANITVAVPARAREPENNAPTDLQEGKMFVYMTLKKYRQASWVQEVHKVYWHCIVQTTVRTT